MLLERLICVTALLAAFAVYGEETSIVVKDAWVRATVPGQDVAGAYMQLTSSLAAKLVRVESPLAKTVEIHTMSMDNGVMRMRPLPALDLPARQTVTLAPGHYHIMLLGLTQQLKTGDSVPLKLHTQDAQGKETVLEVTAAVKGAS